MPTDEDWFEFAAAFPEIREPQKPTDEELARMAMEYQADAIAGAQPEPFNERS